MVKVGGKKEKTRIMVKGATRVIGRMIKAGTRGHL